jgi:DNA-binding SARP family transcriptional activator/tetratricopeptide (TPR) repeat protein
VSYAFRLRCLGAPALFTAAGEQVGFRTRKHLALLVRLALEPGKQFTRDYLADLLWPTAAPQLANHSLAQGLSVIKAKVAREAVVIQRTTVGLAAGWIDADVNHLSSTDAVIEGPFLDAFEIASARPFEDWKDEYRARLIPQIRDCLVRQMDAARRIGDFPTVQRHAERLQDLDPLAEEAIRGIMEARAWASDRSGALKAFARYEAKLLEELGAKPGSDLARMAALLRDGHRTSRSSSGALSTERADKRFEPEMLIGREREFGLLSDAWHIVRRKSPRIIVVTSDPGVGKTTLVNAFAATCQMDGAVVARAQAYDAERDLPFSVLGELVKQLAMQRAIGGADPEALSELTRISSEIVRVFPGVPKPADWSPDLMPLRIADAFLKVITAASLDNPVLVVVDDVHAADNASTAILHSIARKLSEARVLLVLTGRRSELRLSGAPWALTSDTSISRMGTLDLDVLPSDAASMLIARFTSNAAIRKPPVERIMRAAGGNPLALELLTREWSEHGATSLLRDLETLDTTPVPSIGIPRAIGVVFERQTHRLEPQMRAALDFAAVLGRRLSEVGLYAGIGLSAGSALEALSRLRDEGYLREVSGELEFRNELIRAQAYYSVPGAIRQRLHRRVAGLLAAEHPKGDRSICLEVAWHHLRGGNVALALPFAIDGAEAVLGVGVPHAAEEILKAILSAEPPPKNTENLELLLAKALIDQSKAEQASPLIEKLSSSHATTPRESAQIAMLRASAEFLLSRGQGPKYCEAARLALVAAKKTGDGQLIAQALFECARAGTEEGILDLLQTAEREADELEKAPGPIVPMAFLTKAYCRFFLGDPSQARDILHRGLQTTKDNANAAQIALIHSGLGISNHFLCRFEEAYQEHLTALELTRRVGDDGRLCTIAANLCTTLMNRGDYDEAIRYGRMSVECGESSANSTLVISYTNLIDPYMLLGKQSEAVDCLEKATKWMGPERRWKLRLQFLIEAASFALVQRNMALAIDLIEQIERLAHNRETAVAMPGAYWKLKLFRRATLGHWQEAYDAASLLVQRWRTSYTFPYLDLIALKAWMERTKSGAVEGETNEQLQAFSRLGAKGKRQLLVLQGFLEPSDAADREVKVRQMQPGLSQFNLSAAINSGR